LRAPVFESLFRADGLQINEYLSSKLPDWTFENWTSRTRSKQGFPRFVEKEKDYADFTYKDTQKCFAKLIKWGALKAANRCFNMDQIITYHLEVKSTDNDCDEPYFMSNNQIEMVSSSQSLWLT
jgi:hypothetical protein